MRVRKKEDQWMPPRVYRNKVRGKYVSFVYRQGDSSKTITLCSIAATKAEVWVAYESIVSDLNKTYTIQVMASEYLTSGTFRELAPRTQRDRQKELDKFNLVLGKGSLIRLSRIILESIWISVELTVKHKQTTN